MQNVQKEKKPVIYDSGATKILHFTPFKDKICFPLHWHERVEMIYIRKGSIEFTCGSEKGVLSEGQLLAVPPRMAHYGKALTDSAYDVLMFDIRNFYNETDVCKKYLTAMYEGIADFTAVITDSEVTSAVDRICKRGESDSLLAVSEIYALLHLLICGGFIKLSQKPGDNGVRNITDYIEQNFDKELTTAVLCDKFGYTAAHFCRKFKKATGLTPVTYIKIYRLERACKMLQRGEGQVSEIAERCGFSDANYFARCFTAHYHNPPSYYKFKNI